MVSIAETFVFGVYFVFWFFTNASLSVQIFEHHWHLGGDYTDFPHGTVILFCLIFLVFNFITFEFPQRYPMTSTIYTIVLVLEGMFVGGVRMVGDRDW